MSYLGSLINSNNVSIIRRIFGSKCFIKKNDDKLEKFESRVDEGILLGYSSRRKGHKCYIKRLQNIVESIDVMIDEASIGTKKEAQEDDETLPTKIQEVVGEEEREASKEGYENISTTEKNPSRYVQKNHLESQIIGDKEEGI